MKASLRSLSKPVHALPSCTNSIKHAPPPAPLQLDPSPHTQHFIQTQADGQPTPLLAPANTQTYTHRPPPEPALLLILPIVQCSPFQPGLHSHLPSLQVPCSLQRGWHALWSHPVPIQPSSQRQLPDIQMPWPPQSAAQISVGDRDIEKDERRAWGKTDRKEGRGGWRWKRKTRRWLDKETRVKKRQIQELLSRKGGHAPLPCLMAAEKKFLHLIRGNPFWQYKSNMSITKKRHGLWQT